MLRSSIRVVSESSTTSTGRRAVGRRRRRDRRVRRSAAATRPAGSSTSRGLPSPVKGQPADDRAGRGQRGSARTTTVAVSTTRSDADRRGPGAARTRSSRPPAARPRSRARVRPRAGGYGTACVAVPDRRRRWPRRRSSRTHCRTASSGIATVMPTASTIRQSTASSDSGTVSSTVAPRPGSLATDTSPPSRSATSRTASSPTPRPDSSVTVAEVLMPPRMHQRRQLPRGQRRGVDSGVAGRAPHGVEVEAAAVVAAGERRSGCRAARPRR